MADKNQKWEPIEEPDYNRRILSDWEKIYGVSVNLQDDGRFWSEYEWAYHMCNADYIPKTKNFDKLAAMEMRALELRRDVFMSATTHEREILINRYIETDWVRKKLNVLS